MANSELLAGSLAEKLNGHGSRSRAMQRHRGTHLATWEWTPRSTSDVEKRPKLEGIVAKGILPSLIKQKSIQLHLPWRKIRQVGRPRQRQPGRALQEDCACPRAYEDHKYHVYRSGAPKYPRSPTDGSRDAASLVEFCLRSFTNRKVIAKSWNWRRQQREWLVERTPP